MIIAIAYLLAAIIGYLGYRARALTWDGAVAACVVGGTIFGFGGLAPAILLVLFFASSSVLSFVGKKDSRKQRAEEAFEKGGKRDAAQVLANGGVAAVAILLAVVLEGPATALMLGAFVGALAEATADTWATEIGVLSSEPPTLITTGRPVQAGTSGALTIQGSSAGIFGAALIGIVAAMLALFWPSGAAHSVQVVPLLLAAIAGGTIGMLADSLLGATVQAAYFCPKCHKPTESRVHKCGTKTTLVRGVQWINNDVVNFGGTLIGAGVGILVALVFS